MRPSRGALAALAAVLVATSASAGALVQPDEVWVAAGERRPVPEGARVTLLLDKEHYFLGENILLHYFLENTSQAPFTISMGGDYRGASRALRFKVTATAEDGTPVADPDPSRLCMGGRGWTPTVNPRESCVESLPLIRYCRFERPGVYTVRVVHDLGWKATDERKLPVGETRIELRMPTPEQARQVVEEMYRLPDDANRTAGKKCRPYADFTALRHPVYLPILLERAQGADAKALQGIGSIATPEATEALIGLLGHENHPFAAAVGGTLNLRLPDPQFEGKIGPRTPFRSPLDERRQELARKAWRPEFARPVLACARELLTRQDKESVACAAFMIQCLGGKDDLPDLVGALDHAVVAADRAARETNVYPPPRGACRELLRAVRMLFQRGAEPLADPRSPGEAVVFLVALGTREDFRPKGWEATCGRLLRHTIAYVRQTALESVPRPLPKPLVDALPALLADPDLDVRIAACRAAGQTADPRLREPVLRIVASAKDWWPLSTACDAAVRLGARAETLEVLASRIDDTPIGWQCFHILMSSAIDYGNAGGKSTLDAGTARRLKARWTQFVRDHREALAAGRRFEVGSPELTPDLVPPEYKVQSKDGKTLP